MCIVSIYISYNLCYTKDINKRTHNTNTGCLNMKKYNLSEIMKDAWHSMKQNNVGGVYQISFSTALKWAWAYAKRHALVEAATAAVAKSGKYDYIAAEPDPNKRLSLARKAQRELVKAHWAMSAEERKANQINFDGENKFLITLKKACYIVKCGNPLWMYTLGPLPEDL